MTHFWSNLHCVHSKPKFWKGKKVKSLWEQESKGPKKDSQNIIRSPEGGEP
jgi:hypothetical protein